AWEVTALIHGKEEADKAMAGARAAFGGAGGDKAAMPQVRLERARFEAGYNVVDLFFDAGLVPTKSEGRRLVLQGGAFVSTGEGLDAVLDPAACIGVEKLDREGELILRAGKKRYCRVISV
ncbi:MAG: tyrosine--tRNA ligase, partial [Treponema sp.]|nr:tyrosine--tRNA ligase [Treponema sp.]